jgi:hypothetical protein
LREVNLAAWTRAVQLKTNTYEESGFAVCAGYFPPPSHRIVRRRPLFILPSGQGRCGLDASRLTGQAFHRARYALTSDAIQRVQAAHGPPRTKVELYQPTFNFHVREDIKGMAEDA